jgi:ketosteroid isomerase-like protein
MSRSIVPCAFVVASLSACSSSPLPAGNSPSQQAPIASPADATPVKADRRLATIDALKHAVEAKDTRAIAALYTADAVVVPFGGDTRHGQAEIERGEARSLAPAASVRAGAGRVWLKDDVAVVEWKFRATLAPPSKGAAVGSTELAVLWFSPEGRIREEHDYMNEGALRLQAEGDPDAPALPEIPASTEVHDGPARDEAGALAWTQRYEDASSNDDAAALAMLDERITWSCTLGFTADSRAPFPKLLAHWRAAFPDEHTRADRAWPIEDFVIVEETFTGTHKGQLGPFAASGRPVTWHMAEVWQLRDGRIAHGWSYMNFGELGTQVTVPHSQELAKADVPCTFGP